MSIVKLKNARLFFPNLFTAAEFKNSKTFNSKFGIDPAGADHAAVEKAIAEVAEAKFGKKAAARLAAFRPVPQQFPYRDGDGMTWAGAEGLMVLTATKQEKTGKPLVLTNVRHQGKWLELIDESGTPYGRDEDGKLVKVETDEEIKIPYSGCYVNASVEFWAQDGDNAGIRCALRGVQFYRDGDAFAGGSKAKQDEFDDLGAGADADELV